MRRAAKVDANQASIVSGLRKIGASVEILSAVGNGCPDLLVGYRGKNLLLEVKDGNKPPSKRELTDDQVDWHESWRGQVFVVCSIEQAVKAVTG